MIYVRACHFANFALWCEMKEYHGIVFRAIAYLTVYGFSLQSYNSNSFYAVRININGCFILCKSNVNLAKVSMIAVQIKYFI